MSTPHDPSEDRSSERPQNPSHPSYPAYPSTPHPEDTPGYGGSGNPGSPGNPDYYAGYGYAEQPAYGQPAYGQARGTGKVQPMEAVSWAFGTVIRNWVLWILGAVAVGVVVMGTSALVDLAFGGLSGGGVQGGFGYQVAQVLMALLTSALMVFVYHGALRQVDRKKIGFGDFTDNVNFGPAFALTVVLQVVSSVVFAIIAMPLFLAGNPVAENQLASTDEALAALGAVFAGLAVLLVVAVLVAPLTTFMVWFVIDRKATFSGGIVAGFRAGLRNYGRLLAFNLVAGVVVGFAAVLTLGLALIVLGPVLLLAQAMLYRQAAGGPLPEPVR